MKFQHLATWLGLIGLLVALANGQKPLLKGVTILYEPYATSKTNDGIDLTGFAVDLIAKIAEKAGFDYKLNLVGDGAYGVKRDDGKWNGMIGELVDKKVDFAIADLTVTDLRKTAVDFTEPFQSTSLAGLINKADIGSMSTLEDLVNRNEQAAKSGTPQIGYSILESGSTKAAFTQTTDPIG